jgi:hypothetical protein
VGGRRVEVQLRYKQSELMLRDDRPAEARAVLTDLLATVREWGDIVGESRILRRLGQVTVRLGEADVAERLLTTGCRPRRGRWWATSGRSCRRPRRRWSE